MKKNIGLAICFLLIQNFIFSQNEFGSVGSYWRYSFEPHSGGGGWTMIIIEKDTVIDNVIYKKYKWKHHVKPYFEPAIEYSNTGLLRIQNDTIFKDGNVMLDFNMALGDSLNLEGLDVGIQLSVDSITTEEIGGFEYKKWHGQKICVDGGNGTGPYESFTILETIGQIESGYLFWNIDGCAIGGGTNYFDCYKNGAFSYPIGEDCEELFLTSTDALLTNDDIEIYPNPIENLLNVKSVDSKIDKIHLLSLEGKAIYTEDIQSNQFELDMSTMNKGIYYIKLKIRDKVIFKKLIKV